MNDKLGDLLHLGHEARLTIIEVIVEQTQVLHVLFLHRIEHLSLTDLNPDLVLGAASAANQARVLNQLVTHIRCKCELVHRSLPRDDLDVSAIPATLVGDPERGAHTPRIGVISEVFDRSLRVVLFDARVLFLVAISKSAIERRFIGNY